MAVNFNVVRAFKYGFNKTRESGYTQHILLWNTNHTHILVHTSVGRS